MNANPKGPRIIIGLVILVGLALIGLLVPTFLSKSGLPGLTSSNFAPAAGAPAAPTGPQGTAVSLPPVVRSNAVSVARGRVRNSPVPETTIVINSQNTTPQATGDINAPLAMDVLSASYSSSGKPATGCGQITPDLQGQRFDFVVNVTNHTGVNLGAGDWGAQAYSGEKALTLCYFGQTPQLPNLVNDAKTLVTLVAFTDPGEQVTSVVMGTTSGIEARTCFADGKVVPCK